MIYQIQKIFTDYLKWHAEKELWKISSKTNMEVTILRLPLVYGIELKVI